MRSVNKATSAITSGASSEENAAPTAASSRKRHSQTAKVPSASSAGKNARALSSPLFLPQRHHQGEVLAHVDFTVEAIGSRTAISHVNLNRSAINRHVLNSLNRRQSEADPIGRSSGDEFWTIVDQRLDDRRDLVADRGPEPTLLGTTVPRSSIICAVNLGVRGNLTNCQTCTLPVQLCSPGKAFQAARILGRVAKLESAGHRRALRARSRPEARAGNRLPDAAPRAAQGFGDTA